MTETIQLVLRIALGMLLLVAAVAKANSFRRFVSVLRVLTVGGPFISVLVAGAVVIAELVVGAGLMVTNWRWPLYAVSCLFGLFALVLAVALHRQRHETLTCGCFGRSGVVSWGLVFRNLFLACVGLALILHDTALASVSAAGMLFLASASLKPIKSRPPSPMEEIPASRTTRHKPGKENAW
jgi:hypothetical protein